MPKSPEAKERQAEYLRLYKLTHATAGKRVNVTLSDDEFARLEQAARAYGETPTAYLRRLALAALDNRQALTREEEERMDGFVRTIRGIANNVNQMARYSNSVRAMIDERELGYMLQYIEETFRKFLERKDGPP